MKKRTIIMLGLAVASFATPAQAQFLKKLKKAVEAVGEAVGQPAGQTQTTTTNTTATEQQAAAEEVQDPELKGLYRGTIGTAREQETSVQIHETADTKQIVLDELRGTWCGQFGCGLAFVNTPKNGAFYVNEKGEKVFEVSETSHNRQVMEDMKFGDNRVIDCVEKENGTYVYKALFYDNTGKVVKQMANIRAASRFVDGVAAVVTHPTEFGATPILKHVNVKGEFIFPQLDFKGWYGQPVMRPLCDGLAAFMQKDQGNTVWGFRDATGKIVIPAAYKEVLDFSDGLAAVCQRVGETDKWGYIDTTGKMVIQPLYTICPSSFSDGFALVENKNGEHFFIDKTGKQVKGPFERGVDVQPFYRGVATVQGEWTGSWEHSYTYLYDTSFNKVGYFMRTKFGGTDNQVTRYEGDYLYIWDNVKQYYRVANLKGDLLIDGVSDSFSEGKAAFEKGDGSSRGYVDATGQVLVKFVESDF